MLRFKIKITGFEKGKKKVLKKYRKILMKSMFKMEELAIRNAPVDRGSLRQNITLFPEILASKYVLTSKAIQSEALEYGTRPFYAPIEPLKAWAKRKLGDENIGYAIQAKIAKTGITASPFMRPAFHQVNDYWMLTFAKDEFSKE